MSSPVSRRAELKSWEAAKSVLGRRNLNDGSDNQDSFRGDCAWPMGERRHLAVSVSANDGRRPNGPDTNPKQCFTHRTRCFKHQERCFRYKKRCFKALKEPPAQKYADWTPGRREFESSCAAAGSILAAVHGLPSKITRGHSRRPRRQSDCRIKQSRPMPRVRRRLRAVTNETVA